MRRPLSSSPLLPPHFEHSLTPRPRRRRHHQGHQGRARVREVGGPALRPREQHPDRHQVLPREPALEAAHAHLRAHHGRACELSPCVPLPLVALAASASRADHELSPSLAVAGDHTRTVSIVAPTVGGLMKFAVKTVTCLGCKTPLKPGTPSPSLSLSLSLPLRARTDPSFLPRSLADQAVCHNCRPRTAELHRRQVTLAASAETAFARLWTQCQRCQGSLHQVRRAHPCSSALVSLRDSADMGMPCRSQDVLCTSKDCPIFYMRKKAQKEAVDAVGTLQRCTSPSPSSSLRAPRTAADPLPPSCSQSTASGERALSRLC